ncbi:cofilin [Peltigera leucophlebia]|nr:cofilin [Peltigera leucophlebia]
MSKSGVSINPECVLKYNELKLEKKLKYIIYRLSDDYKEIIVEDASSDEDWEVFQGKLLNAKASHKGREGKGPRFAVYDFEYELGGGEGTRNKLVFISWSPDEGTLVFPRMTYASSKVALKNSLPGLSIEVQANRDDEIEYATILNDLTKGRR